MRMTRMPSNHQYSEPFESAAANKPEARFCGSNNESKYNIPLFPAIKQSLAGSKRHTDSGRETGEDTDGGSSVAPVPPPLKPRPAGLIYHTPRMKSSRRQETETPNGHQQVVREDSVHGTFVHNPIYKPKVATSQSGSRNSSWQSCRIPLKEDPERPHQGFALIQPSRSFIVQRPGGCCTITVKNIAPNVGDMQVLSMFETFGDLNSLKIECCPHAYSSPGVRVALIKYEEPDQARRAVSTMNGEVVQGCTLTVALHPTRRDRADFNLLQNQYWSDVNNGRMEGLVVEVEGNNKYQQVICPTFAKLSNVKTNRISFALVKQLGYPFAERDEYELQEGHDSAPVVIYGYLKLRLRIHGHEWVDLTFKITPHLPNGVELNKKTQAIMGLIQPEAVEKEKAKVITTLKRFKFFKRCITSTTL